MKKYFKYLTAGVIIILLMSAPVLSQKKYYRGNTHSHCYPKSGDITDTSYTAAVIVAQYKAKGYDFLAFTDHGAYWNASGLSTPDFTVISGEEPGISGNNRWGHFTGLNMKSQVSGSGLTHQQLIDLIYNQGAVPFINHPRYTQIPITALQIINDMKNNLMHMEVYNAVALYSPPMDDFSVWDSVLSTGRLIYGVASDDSHRESHQGKGWIMVYASSINRDTLVKSIRNGDYYCSNGAVIDSISITDSTYFVRCSSNSTFRFIGNGGAVVSTLYGTSATYKFKGNEKYIRCEVINSQNLKAWTQPKMIPAPSEVDRETYFPQGLILRQNYPNPFNPKTTINYELKIKNYEPETASPVTLKIYDLLGREVETFNLDFPFDKMGLGGVSSFEWDGSKFPSGTYFYELRVRNYREVKKMVLMK